MRLLSRIILGAIFSICCAQAAFAVTTYTQCSRSPLPQPFDPAVANSWGALENTGRVLIDAQVGGTNVVLTVANGAPDQTRNTHFTFTGVLTGNIDVLFPLGGCQVMSVTNNTTGAFTLSVGVNNGSAAPDGAVTAVPQGGTLPLFSDGTNVFGYINRIGLGAAASGANSDITSLSGLTTPLSVPQGGTGVAGLAAGYPLLGNGSGGISGAVPTSSPYPLVSNGVTPANPSFPALPSAGLAATTVTAGSYNAANITVNAEGQITAAASGPVQLLSSGNLLTGSTTGLALSLGSYTAYKQFKLFINGLTDGSNATCNLVLSVNGGSSYLTSYTYASTSANTGATTTAAGGVTAGTIPFGTVNTTASTSTEMTFSGINLAVIPTVYFNTTEPGNLAGNISTTGSGYPGSSTTINAFAVSVSTGTVTGGTYSLYGYQ